MFRFTRSIRPRAFAAILLIGAALITLAAPSRQTAAHPAGHEVPQGPVAYLTAATRADVLAEAAIDSLTRSLSREHGYHADSFTVDTYTLPAELEGGLAERFAAAYQAEGWTATPELSVSGRTYAAQGWTSHGGKHALVVAYGHDTAGGPFVAIIQAVR